jgi:hypothetical protein
MAIPLDPARCPQRSSSGAGRSICEASCHSLRSAKRDRVLRTGRPAGIDPHLRLERLPGAVSCRRQRGSLPVAAAFTTSTEPRNVVVAGCC